MLNLSLFCFCVDDVSNFTLIWVSTARLLLGEWRCCGSTVPFEKLHSTWKIFLFMSSQMCSNIKYLFFFPTKGIGIKSSFTQFFKRNVWSWTEIFSWVREWIFCRKFYTIVKLIDFFVYSNNYFCPFLFKGMLLCCSPGCSVKLCSEAFWKTFSE